MEITFRSDTAHRKHRFDARHFAHPAKMHLSLCLWLIHNYTKPSDVVLDPMAGSGTLLLACSLGRNVVLVELEDKFVKMCERNWERIQQIGPQMGCEMGWAVIQQGDARALPLDSADAVLFSPPFADINLRSQMDEGDKDMRIETGKLPRLGTSCHKVEYSRNPSNIGNLPHGDIDAIITSPPYEGIERAGKSGIDNTKLRHKRSRYQSSIRAREIIAEGYSAALDNIGNLKSDSYLAAMLQVYQECYRVLKPEGLLILVTKNFIRDKKEVRLDKDTIQLCEAAGFSFVERHYRKLTSQSFWRVIYQQKHPDAPVIDREDVLVFRKAILP